MMGGQVGNKGKLSWDVIAADRRRRRQKKKKKKKKKKKIYNPAS